MYSSMSSELYIIRPQCLHPLSSSCQRLTFSLLYCIGTSYYTFSTTCSLSGLVLSCCLFLLFHIINLLNTLYSLILWLNNWRLKHLRKCNILRTILTHKYVLIDVVIILAYFLTSEFKSWSRWDIHCIESCEVVGVFIIRFLTIYLNIILLIGKCLKIIVLCTSSAKVWSIYCLFQSHLINCIQVCLFCLEQHWFLTQDTIQSIFIIEYLGLFLLFLNFLLNQQFKFLTRVVSFWFHIYNLNYNQ